MTGFRLSLPGDGYYAHAIIVSKVNMALVSLSTVGAALVLQTSGIMLQSGTWTVHIPSTPPKVTYELSRGHHRENESVA